MPHDVTLRDKNEGRYPHQRGEKGEKIKLSAEDKREGDGNDGADPKTPLKYGKIGK